MSTKQNLEKILVEYTTGEHRGFKKFLNRMSKPSLVDTFIHILVMYANDSNSSAVREQVTTKIAGYTHRSEKLGYNGFKRDVKGATVDCEVKPANLNTNRGTKPKKLNGSGTFNDYTWARFRKDKRAKPNILVSGFVDGRLLYIIEFPFTCKSFLRKLESRLEKRLPNGDEPEQYVRGAGFSYLDYIGDKGAKLLYRTQDRVFLEKHTVRKFHHWLSQQEPRK